MVPLLLVLLALVLGAALGFFWLSRRLQVSAGLPAGARIVYADTGGWKRVEKPLFSERYRLTGKPDYIVEQGGARIPVEVKPNRRDGEPRQSDIMQLAAYGLLVEETFGVAPPFGLLKYRDTVWQIQLEPLRHELFELLHQMRSDVEADEVARSHAEPWHCRYCGYRSSCGQDLSAPAGDRQAGPVD